jgi:hypothetical protein
MHHQKTICEKDVEGRSHANFKKLFWHTAGQRLRKNMKDLNLGLPMYEAEVLITESQHSLKCGLQFQSRYQPFHLEGHRVDLLLVVVLFIDAFSTICYKGSSMRMTVNNGFKRT